MCIICRKENLEGLTKIDCSFCKTLTRIDYLPNTLISIDLYDCINLTEIFYLPPLLEIINCNGCESLVNLPPFPDTLIELYSSRCNFINLPLFPDSLRKIISIDCPNLVYLPKLPPSLYNLHVSNCINLLSIPELPLSIDDLDCYKCSKLTRIPFIPDSLLMLDCSNCKGLTVLCPNKIIPKLHTLICYGCRFRTLPKLPLLDNLDGYYKCFWSPFYLDGSPDGSPNPEYPDKMRKLKIIQRLFRKHYLRHKFSIRIILRKHTIIPMAIIDSICREYL